MPTFNEILFKKPGPSFLYIRGNYMNTYAYPEVLSPTPRKNNEIVLLASGDLRQSANIDCWPAQKEMEAKISEALKAEGYQGIRAHMFDPEEGHGFISSQCKGMDVCKDINPKSRLIIIVSVL
jgi:hypothetical protein